MPGSIVLASTGRTLATDVRWARTRSERLRGLLATQLDDGAALVIAPCRQVHTFGMRYPIDVAFCDASWVVRHVVRALRPRRVSRLVVAARCAIEMRAHALGDDVVPGCALVVRAGDHDVNER